MPIPTNMLMQNYIHQHCHPAHTHTDILSRAPTQRSNEAKSDGMTIKPNEISHVELGSQADLAGIETGWEVVAFEDVPLTTREHLFRELVVTKALGEGNEHQKPKSPFKLTMYTVPPVVSDQIRLSAQQSVEETRRQVVNTPTHAQKYL